MLYCLSSLTGHALVEIQQEENSTGHRDNSRLHNDLALVIGEGLITGPTL
jgi:hypothetical protein